MSSAPAKAPSTPKKAIGTAPSKAPGAPTKKKLAEAAEIAETETNEPKVVAAIAKKTTESAAKKTVGQKRARKAEDDENEDENIKEESVKSESDASVAVKSEDGVEGSAKRARNNGTHDFIRKNAIKKLVHAIWPGKKAANLVDTIIDSIIKHDTTVFERCYTYSRDARRTTVQLKDAQQAIKGLPFSSMI
jgi:histone H3/H4